MTPEDKAILGTVMNWLWPMVMAVLGFLIKGWIQKADDRAAAAEKKADGLQIQNTEFDKGLALVKKDVQFISELLATLRGVKEEWGIMKLEISQVALELKNLKTSLEDVIILKRDHQTMWKRLDEVREELKGKS